jgi:hypothetical protein
MSATAARTQQPCAGMTEQLRSKPLMPDELRMPLVDELANELRHYRHSKMASAALAEHILAIPRIHAAIAAHDSAMAETLRDAVVAAYIAGATDVHNNWQEDRDPDFTEAAHDYAADAI